MTGTYTGNLNLYNPSLAEVGWKDEWDSNFQILDTSIGTYLNADGSFKAATAAAIPFFASGFSATNVYDAIVEAAAGGVPTVWGGITGSIINQTDLQLVLDGKVDENIAIVGSTQTKITYDSKGLVTSGSAATTADIADSLNARYVTDAQLSVLNTTSGTNTGDQTKTIENITLTATNISNKYVDLAHVPLDFTAVGVFPVVGIKQLYSVDFSVITNGSSIRRLSWNGLGLESLLEEGDIISVDYIY